MSRPEVIAFCSADKIRDPHWTPEVCACGATLTLDGMPERRIANETHGVCVCYRDAQPSPECCQDCGAPFNNAEAPASGLCAACFELGPAMDYAIAERECLMDYEDSRGIDR